MLIDHIGLIFFPDIRWIRYIGRLAMPVFGYCIARGFYYSKEHGTLKNYIKNLLILTIASEIPYYLMEKKLAIDIGLTWLISVIVLCILEDDMFISFDYGIYGSLTAVCMYYLMIKKNDPYNMFLALVILWAIYVLIMRQAFEQFFAVFSIIPIALLKPIDERVKIPKRLYYWFYPVHMIVLLILERIIVK